MITIYAQNAISKLPNPLAPLGVFAYNMRRMPGRKRRHNSVPSRVFDLQEFLATRSEAVNRALDHFLPAATVRPATMHQSMRYSLFAGGKRMRPALCLAAAAACGGREAEAMPPPRRKKAARPT